MTSTTKSAPVSYKQGQPRADTRKLDKKLKDHSSSLTGIQEELETKADLGEGEINAQTGTSYTLVLADKGKLIEMNNASPNTLTVPPNTDVAFPVGSEIHWVQRGAGLTTLVAGSGVTVNSFDGILTSLGQYAGGTLKKRGTNSWYALGGLG